MASTVRTSPSSEARSRWSPRPTLLRLEPISTAPGSPGPAEEGTEHLMPASGNAADRRDFDIPASQTAQDHFNAVAAHLESLISQRDRDVAMALADYVADGASEEYHAKEQRWHRVAGEV